MLRNFIAGLVVLLVLAVPVAAQGESIGDANGDGVVNSVDFEIWFQNRFTGGTDVLTGDFTGDGITDGQDFIVWNTNKSTPAASPLQNVPEPTALVLLLLSTLLVRLRSRRSG